ncbi:uncharacterized protein DDB_G0284459-like isoform X6 [Nilaparvata lugens]|uniref:uncharacterized protein DDB_G0284459-like isoform X6 n=1 Tax=Nilaparvata lugens TaxID=108931 RepID=UPI00193CCF02|nr:uncharacterized protein DDB_G0284459-like isoform X6 [Nilaparvata lugens]
MPAEDSEMQRRHSSVSEANTNGLSEFGALKRQTSHENVELIPTRTTKVATSKPAANPLQFIKVGPCNLYRSAQEQLKKVEEVKKVKKEVRDDAEDWQSNLDNWKCSRRKKQEHIIERVVEVKKLELEEHDRNRRRSKTFSEMMEERGSRGRKMSLPVYQDDDNDLSDLGISKCASARDNDVFDEEHEHNGDSSDNHDETNCSRVKQNGTNGHKDEELSRTSSETEEYTYEGAIQSYRNFTETRVKSKSCSNSSRSSPEENGAQSYKRSPPVPAKPRRGSTTKIEAKLSELEQLKKRSMSTTDLSSGESNRKPVVVPKVDINKRRELFEKSSDQDDQVGKVSRLSGDFTNSKSIRERLSSFSKQSEESQGKKKLDRVSSEVSVRDRLSSIERQQSTENLSSVKQQVTETTQNSQSVRERLNSLEKSSNKEPVKSVTTSPIRSVKEEVEEEEKPVVKCEEPCRVAEKIVEVTTTNGCFVNEKQVENVSSDIERISSPEEEMYGSKRQQHFRHRSLDSLDVDSNEGLGNECFERVQSLEDLDFCRNYPASSMSGDTDREDSGIHTADVSSSVSQADDCDSHLDSSSVDTEFKFQRQTIIEEDLRQPILEIPPTQLTSDTSCQLPTSKPMKEDLKPIKNEDSSMNGDWNMCRNEKVTSLKSEVLPLMMNDKIEIYNDIEECKRVTSNSTTNVELVQTVSVCKNEMMIEDLQADKKQTIPTVSTVNDRTNFFIANNSNKLPELNMNVVNGELEGGGGAAIVFPLSPSALEPPKEKPPPPPAELSDDDDSSTQHKPSALRRLDSTKRIKKEIRLKRSSFLGLEGGNDDSLEPDLDIQPPPDMTTFLQEERRLEQMMYRQSICSESDSNQGESRDSGVELDRGHHDDISWPEHNHSRNDSETFGNNSSTSEEEENTKKEREVNERNQENQSYIIAAQQEQNNIGEKLALRLRELEAEKTRLEWEREEEMTRRKAEEAARCHQESMIQAREEELRKQEELLISERERLEREQEELSRQRETLVLQQQWAASLQDVSQPTAAPVDDGHPSEAVLDYRRSMPNLQQQDASPPPPPQPLLPSTRHSRPPPPIPPAKPLVIPRTPLQEKPVKRTNSPQQMTRQTLQALSAAPRSRLIATDTWMKRKPKQDNQNNNNYNYQHWLIQEAEHRRITELQQRQAAVPPKRPVPPHPSAYPVASPRNSTSTTSSVWQQPPPPPQSSSGGQHWASTAQPAPQPPQWVASSPPQRNDKPLPDEIIQTLTQRVQNRINNNHLSAAASINNGLAANNNRRRHEMNSAQLVVDPQQRVMQLKTEPQQLQQEKMLSVSGKKKCSHCGDELGRGAAMIIETLRLFYHIDCFKCCVCCVQLGDGLMGTDVRVRNNKLHCHNCYSSDDGVKFSCV